MRYDAPRFSHVPWLGDEADLRPMGEAETMVEMPGRVAAGFLIIEPFGRDTNAMITVIAEGDELLAIAITNEMHFDVPAKRTMDVTLLSNPRRRVDEDDA